MKKITLLFAAMLLSFGAQAQIVSSSSRSITTTAKAPSTTTHYMRVGLNFMKYTGDGGEDCSSKLGYDVTFGFQKAIGTSGLYWGMEYGLSSRGAKWSDSYEGASYEYSEMCHNILYSPFTLGFKYNFSGKWSVDPHLGVFVSADYTGKAKETFEYKGDKEEESYSMSDWDDYNRVDVGIRFGVGVWYDRFNLDLTYQHGFLDSWEKTKSGNVMLRLGIAF